MSIDLPGFADPVAGAQACFRAALGAMSRPGSRHRAGIGLIPPAPLDPATAAMLLTLVDSDTPLSLGPELAAATDWIAFHCGAAPADDITAARFVVATTLPDIAALAAGSDDAPEESATIILQVAGFEHGQRLRLAGPGLREPVSLTLAGLPEDFVAAWAANHALYPRGVDLILCAGHDIVALPRSVAIIGET
jgi:alpha-D-ribose 1-methylphosphonate 5-triphosphate synthase subunit PhnH